MRTFFDELFSSEARQALLRTRFQRTSAGVRDSQGAGRKFAIPPVDSRPKSQQVQDHAEDAKHILLYRGADGIGKTRVFRQFRENASQKRISVYEVNHHDVEGIPFKPFLHAIREILRDHSQGAALQEKYRYGLESVMPELYGADAGEAQAMVMPKSTGSMEAGGTIEFDEAGKVRIFEAITQLLLEVTAYKPLLILVHDLHWSDLPTIELLDYIGRNLHTQEKVPVESPGAAGGLGGSVLLADIGAGPELDDFEGDEWRALTRSTASAQELLGVPYYAFPPGVARGEARWGRSPQPAGSALMPLAASAAIDKDVRTVKGSESLEAAATTSHLKPAEGARLMILANYRGFVNEAHYLEQALRALGEQPFAYHGELRPLNASEAEQFLALCLQDVEVGGMRVRVSPDLVHAIFEASEGFPSFMQELLRALYLGEGVFDRSIGPGEDPLSVWSGQSIVEALASFLTVPSFSSTDPMVSPGPALPLGRIDFPDDGQPLRRRHAIVRLRLSSATKNELRVLQAMATARRPVTPTLLRHVLEGLFDAPPLDGASPVDSVSSALVALEDRGIVERHESPGDSYFFRLWDYALVVEEAIPVEQKRVLHQRVGEEYRAKLAGKSDEAAFEVYYHLRRGLEPQSSIPHGRIAVQRFVRAFALEKARRVQYRMIELLSAPEDKAQRLEILEQTARISLALKAGPAAEEILRRTQTEGGAELSSERKVELVLLEAEAARLTDPAKGLKILGKASKHLKDENTRLGVRLQLATARMRLERQDLKRAINFSLNGASICQKIGDVPELGEIYRIMASAFYRKGDYAHAVDNYERALDAFERLGLKEASVGALDELGRVYLERGHHFRAARYLYKSLEIRRRQHDLPGLCRSYDELGRVYLRSGDYLKTIEILNRSLALKERIGDFVGQNPTSVILGDLYFRLGRYEKSLEYFRREIDNSQKLGETRGLVEGICQLGRVHLEIGDLKEAEVYSKQVSILATEFKLRSQEADGALLEGNLKALGRDWNAAEKSLKFASEVHGKLGHRRREVSALLDLAEMKLVRELLDESLKYASRGQLIAEEVKALDLQVRALTIKGNIHRFLKGGNIEKAREFLHKALELSQKISDVTTLFQLYYSLAKVCHSQREFAEAANYYGKAELILKQTGERLTEDRSARYFEDRRRKTFAEDLARFRKDALGRATTSPPAEVREPQASSGQKDRPVGFSDFKDLATRILRVHSELSQLHFYDRVLGEAVDLAGADRGFILRVQNRQYFPVAFHGFGKDPLQHPEYQAASGIAQESVKRGRSILATGGGELTSEKPEASQKPEKQERGLTLGALSHCSILVVPFMTDERIFGGVYLDKPVVVGQFLPRNQSLLETFAQHAAVALSNRRELEIAVREPVTGFYTASYFLERLKEAYRWFNLHGKSFTLLGYYLPQLDEAIGEGRAELAQELARDLVTLLPHEAAICWGAPVLSVLLAESDLSAQNEIAARVGDKLAARVGVTVPMEILSASNRFHQGAEIYFELRRRLLPEAHDRKVLNELIALLEPQITLREAKLILERHKIETTLRKTGGNITHAARELGVHRPQLSNLLKKHDLKRGIYVSEQNEEEIDSVAEPGDN